MDVDRRFHLAHLTAQRANLTAQLAAQLAHLVAHHG